MCDVICARVDSIASTSLGPGGKRGGPALGIRSDTRLARHQAQSGTKTSLIKDKFTQTGLLKAIFTPLKVYILTKKSVGKCRITTKQQDKCKVVLHNIYSVNSAKTMIA